MRLQPPGPACASVCKNSTRVLGSAEITAKCAFGCPGEITAKLRKCEGMAYPNPRSCHEAGPVWRQQISFHWVPAAQHNLSLPDANSQQTTHKGRASNQSISSQPRPEYTVTTLGHNLVRTLHGLS